jgi:fructose-bisphosphate aldolase class 1
MWEIKEVKVEEITKEQMESEIAELESQQSILDKVITKTINLLGGKR